MKVLYAAQATGNGHLSRAREIVPLILPYGTVDVFLSGTEAEVKLPFPIAYQKYGTSFIFGTKGGIDVWQTLRSLKPMRFFNDLRQCPINQYDVIINDFEPIVAWACRRQGRQCIGLSHQGAFLSNRTPRIQPRNPIMELLFTHYAPTSDMYAFHFDRYDDFINTPVIRSEIRQAEITNKGHIAVYLPAVSDETLIKHCSKVRSVVWKVFSKRAKQFYMVKNVEIHPIHNEKWIEAVASAEGTLMGGGFEGPAEALFLGKKLLTMPMIGQYEQQCNAEALKRMGVQVVYKIGKDFHAILEDWLKNISPIQVNYPDETAQIVQKIFEK